MLVGYPMPPTVDVHIEVPEPYTYKPKKIDDAGFMRDVGIGVLIAIGAIAIVVVAIRKLRDRKLSVAAKLVDHEEMTLVGIVRARDKTLVAPLSGKACVAHKTRVTWMDEPGSSEGRGVFGEVPARTGGAVGGVGGVSFDLELRDGTRVQIDGGVITLDVTPYRLPPNPERERALLVEHGNVDKHDRAGFDEIAVEPGMKIAIRGMVRIEQDPNATAERGYRDDAPTRIRLDRNGDKPITVVRVWDAS